MLHFLIIAPLIHLCSVSVLQILWNRTVQRWPHLAPFVKGSGSFPLGFHGDEGAHCKVKFDHAPCRSAACVCCPDYVATVVSTISFCCFQVRWGVGQKEDSTLLLTWSVVWTAKKAGSGVLSSWLCRYPYAVLPGSMCTPNTLEELMGNFRNECVP